VVKRNRIYLAKMFVGVGITVAPLKKREYSLIAKGWENNKSLLFM
jgi:hypothetical protein